MANQPLASIDYKQSSSIVGIKKQESLETAISQSGKTESSDISLATKKVKTAKICLKDMTN